MAKKLALCVLALCVLALCATPVVAQDASTIKAKCGQPIMLTVACDQDAPKAASQMTTTSSATAPTPVIIPATATGSTRIVVKVGNAELRVYQALTAAKCHPSWLSSALRVAKLDADAIVRTPINIDVPTTCGAQAPANADEVMAALSAYQHRAERDRAGLRSGIAKRDKIIADATVAAKKAAEVVGAKVDKDTSLVDAIDAVAAKSETLKNDKERAEKKALELGSLLDKLTAGIHRLALKLGVTEKDKDGKAKDADVVLESSIVEVGNVQAARDSASMWRYIFLALLLVALVGCAWLYRKARQPVAPTPQTPDVRSLLGGPDSAPATPAAPATIAGPEGDPVEELRRQAEAEEAAAQAQPPAEPPAAPAAPAEDLPRRGN